MQYFVVMIDYGCRGREAIFNPGITRLEVVSRIASGEYANISFIHEIVDRSVEDVTAEILNEVVPPKIAVTDAKSAGRHQLDHIRDLRELSVRDPTSLQSPFSSKYCD